MIRWEDLNAKEQSVVEAVLYGDFESRHEASTQEKIRYYLFEYGCYSDEFGSEAKIMEYIQNKEV